ncbi:MAG: glycosyltransferase family 39 protein [Alphaproteobacteria bacterium]|nr:glycosyltransferase family 39 protein [Alphaproteobacteria bacterium]
MDAFSDAAAVPAPPATISYNSFDLAAYFAASPARQALLLIGLFTALRLWLAFVIGLGVDESYTLAIARDGISLSYFDHPPLHVWLAHVSEWVFGDGQAARLPFVALSAGTGWLLFRLTAALFGARAGLWALIAFNLTFFFGVVAGGWVLPDGPLDFFLLAAANAFVPVLQGEAPSWRRWLLIGALIGLAGLSKYHALFFGLGLLGFIAAAPRLRPLFARPEPYAGIAVATLLFAPVLIWNAQHHWVSFAFQGGRADAHGFYPAAPLIQIAGQLLLLSPWVFFPLAFAALKARRDHSDAARLCLWLGAPAVLFFTLVALVCGHGMIHWSMPGWLLLFPLLGAELERTARVKAWPRRWAAASLVLFLSMTAFAAAAASTGFLGADFPGLFPKGDPTIESAPWDGLRAALAARGLLGRPHLMLTALSWCDGAKADQALDGAMAVTVFSRDPRGFAFLRRPARGEDSLIVMRPREVARLLPRLAAHFRLLRELAPVAIGRDGRTEFTLRLFYAGDLLASYPGAYGH